MLRRQVECSGHGWTWTEEEMCMVGSVRTTEASLREGRCGGDKSCAAVTLLCSQDIGPKRGGRLRVGSRQD